MKIAYICHSYPPMISGAAIAVQNLAAGFARRSHSVLVLTASDREEPYLEEANGVRIVRLRSKRNYLRTDQRFVLASSREVLAELSSFRPDVIHIHDPFNLALVGLQASRQLNIPSVYTTHQLPWFIASYFPNLPGMRSLIESLFWAYARWILRKFDAVIAPSVTVSQLLEQRGKVSSQVISCGIDTSRFNSYPRDFTGTSLLEKYNLSAKQPTLIYVGRIDTDKRVDLVVKAFTKARMEVGGQLLVIGDGTQRRKVIELCKDLVPAGYYCFPGFISNPTELAGLYHEASIFATASEIETLGIAVLEAMSTGLPVVAVGKGALPELVQNGVNGYLVEPDNPSAMADKILHLWTNPHKALEMGRASRNIVAIHSIEATLDHHEALYTRIINNRWFVTSAGTRQLAF